MTQRRETLRTYKVTTSNKTMSILKKLKLLNLSHRHLQNFCLNNMQPWQQSSSSWQVATSLLENLPSKHMNQEMHLLKLSI